MAKVVSVPAAFLKRKPEESLKILTDGSSAADVARALEIQEGQLLYILYKRDSSKHYRTFKIPKKSGGQRHIMAPEKSLNILQHKLLGILYPTYAPPTWVHGFVSKKGIVTNASEHVKKRFVLNVDLKDFYDHIHFGRVRGILMRPPYKFKDKVATVVAQIVTYDNRLPQGACTSPLMSNLVAWALDRKLVSLAKKYKLTFTRYADDITFSTSRKSISANMAHWAEPNPIAGSPEVGKDLRQAIEDAGFKVNDGKVRVQVPGTHQEVTGLTVNEFPNVHRKHIRNIRALLHSWRTRTLLPAEAHHIAKHARNPPNIPAEKRDGSYFRQVVYGHMAFIKQVRGDTDRIYLKLCSDVALLDATPPKFILEGKGKLDMFDFFICHASEDKADVARPLDAALTADGAKVFLDEKQIKLGDSFIQKINHALGRSKHVVAIISTNSFKKYWPLMELSSVLAMEATKGSKLLPIMVGTPSEILGFQQELPLLCHRLHHHWDPTLALQANVDAAKKKLIDVWRPSATP
jgi:RNA-directed DNA polymerase